MHTHTNTHTLERVIQNKAYDRFSVGNSASKEIVKQHLQSMKENCQSKFCIQWAYLPKKRNRLFQTQERIHYQQTESLVMKKILHQQTHTTRNVKESSSVRRKMTQYGSMVLLIPKVMKSTRKVTTQLKIWDFF